MALWFHDAVYDPEREDNEDKSARWAIEALKTIRVADDRVRRIARLIRATKPGVKSRTARINGLELMLDIDMAILGSDRARFEEYERQVRREYAHAPDESFARSRSDFIEAMLGNDVIYRTEILRLELEARARCARCMPCVGADLTTGSDRMVEWSNVLRGSARIWRSNSGCSRDARLSPSALTA